MFDMGLCFAKTVKYWNEYSPVFCETVFGTVLVPGTGVQPYPWYTIPTLIYPTLQIGRFGQCIGIMGLTLKIFIILPKDSFKNTAYIRQIVHMWRRQP